MATSAALLVFLCFLSNNFNSVLSLKITSPTDGASVNLNEPTIISWTSVETDPSTFNIQLVNNNAGTYPTGFSTVFHSNISTADGTYTANDLQNLKGGSGYQFNFVAENSGILAQSGQFNIVNGSNLTASMPNSSIPLSNSTFNSTSFTKNTNSTSKFNSTVTTSSPKSNSNTQSSTMFNSSANNHAQSSAGQLQPFKSRVLVSLFSLFVIAVLG